MGLIGFIASLTFSVIIFGILFMFIGVIVDFAPGEIAGDVRGVESSLKLIRPGIGLEYAPILLVVLVVLVIVHLLFMRKRN